MKKDIGFIAEVFAYATLLMFVCLLPHKGLEASAVAAVLSPAILVAKLAISMATAAVVRDRSKSTVRLAMLVAPVVVFILF